MSSVHARRSGKGQAQVETPARPSEPHDRIALLWDRIQEVRTGARLSPRTAKLLQGGAPKMAQKLIEEAAETGIEAVRGERSAVLNESVDLIYNLVVLWSQLGLEPEAVWAEMDRRDAQLGMAEKLPKTGGGE